MIIESEASNVPIWPRDFVLLTIGGYIRTRHEIYQASTRYNRIAGTTKSIAHRLATKVCIVWIHLK